MFKRKRNSKDKIKLDMSFEQAIDKALGVNDDSILPFPIFKPTIMTTKERIEHLEKLLQTISECEERESAYNRLLKLLTDEFDYEFKIEADFRENEFLNNLRQTRDKQGQQFESASKRDKYQAYKDFTSNFHHDVLLEITRLKSLNQNDLNK